MSERLMTCVFACDVRSLQSNPFHIDTPFGKPLVVSDGDLAGEFDRMEARADEAERLLPPPDKLEMLADWIDVKYPDDDDPEVQLDLRRWARDIRAFLASKENPDDHT